MDAVEVLETALGRLRTILHDVWDRRPAAVAIDPDTSLLDLGIDSLTFVLFLDEVGTEFRIDMEAAAPRVDGSLRSLAELIVERGN